MDLLLVPVDAAVPTLEALLVAHPADGAPLTTDEFLALARLFTRVIETNELLVRYSVVLAGKPGSS